MTRITIDLLDNGYVQITDSEMAKVFAWCDEHEKDFQIMVVNRPTAAEPAADLEASSGT